MKRQPHILRALVPSPYLPHACALISAEAAGYALRGGPDVGEAVSVELFGVGAHAGNGEDLLVLLHALLELPKQHSKTCLRQYWGSACAGRRGSVPPA